MTSRRDPLSRSTLWQLVAGVVALVAVGAAIGWLHHTRPTAELEQVLPGAPDPAVDDDLHISCQRTLPDHLRVTTEAGEDLPEPVGRVISTEVVECPTNFDRHHVEFVGEVVGDVLRRSDGAWVLMNDDVYALERGPLQNHQHYGGGNTGLAVWLPGQLADIPDEPGRYGIRGDILRVTGVLFRTDPADGGGLTIRARHAEVLAEAERIGPPFDTAQAIVAGILVVVAAGFAFADRRDLLRR